MNWNRQTFEPHRPSPKYPERYRFPSPPLCRLCGAIGFTAGALLVFYVTAATFGVEHDFISTAGWEFKEIIVLGSSLLAGILCGLLGFGLGASVEVRSEHRNHLLAVIWHYLANGSILWFFLLSLVLTKVLGQTGIKQHVDHFGIWYSTFAIAGTGTIGSLACAGVLLLAGQIKYLEKPRFLPCLLLSMPISIAMGYMQFRLLEISTGYWWIISVIFPFPLIPLSTMMVARDLRQRRDLLSMSRK